jgi:hypothetical protein
VEKIIQVMPWPEGWEAVFFSYDDTELFFEPVFCWALVSEKPYVGNGEEEKTYIEGQVMVANGSNIAGVYDLPQCAGMRKLHGNIAFLGYQNTKLPEKNRKEQMDHFKDQAKDLLEIRSSSNGRT